MRFSLRRAKQPEAVSDAVEEPAVGSHMNGLEIQHLLDGCNDEICHACALHDADSLSRIMNRKKELRAQLPTQHFDSEESAENAGELHALIVQTNQLRDRMLHAANSEELRKLKEEKDAVQRQIQLLLQGIQRSSA